MRSLVLAKFVLLMLYRKRDRVRLFVISCDKSNERSRLPQNKAIALGWFPQKKLLEKAYLLHVFCYFLIPLRILRISFISYSGVTALQGSSRIIG